MLRIVFWQRKVRLSSNLGQFNFASVSLYDVPGRIIRKTLFWTISIFFDRYFGRVLCQGIENCKFLRKFVQISFLDSILNYIAISGCKQMFSTNFIKTCCSFA